MCSPLVLGTDLIWVQTMTSSGHLVPPKLSPWVLGEDGIAFEDLFLVQLDNTLGNVFQAVVQVIK